MLQEIRERLGPDGTISISLDELKALSQTEFGKLHTSIGEMQKTLKEIGAKQNSIIDYLRACLKR